VHAINGYGLGSIGVARADADSAYSTCISCDGYGACISSTTPNRRAIRWLS
jgi:hypothetical protein